jgi:hypothetical protein
VAALEQYAVLSRQQALTPQTPSMQSGWPDTIIMGLHPERVEAGQALAEAQRKAQAFTACLGQGEAMVAYESASACARQVDPNYPELNGP